MALAGQLGPVADPALKPADVTDVGDGPPAAASCVGAMVGSWFMLGLKWTPTTQQGACQPEFWKAHNPASRRWRPGLVPIISAISHILKIAVVSMPPARPAPLMSCGCPVAPVFPKGST